ncbi:MULTISPECIES: MdtA/MuxA family multidrug efflux RND transporter periplasmic adaptor subunit [Cupriavidus]|jgi:membrane fusion protein, multidrug efflux system|uniref:MdtA/MuxA family multidrug efflux RND transporter periplasmic adaptor subunit n=2 Tax=Cupriavidus metallidurans TaxID=119219 RepID=A0A132HH78_9BURK|nr:MULTISPECIES: MdtA/MuxA family multidrug efflux RND transporter periplasmic adaptor subunit [Cupriavidus]KWR83490.1 efflux transporter periplasmic adaptor subunit [Cupriavidus sp. SHE]KWW36154.1 Multidrug resistance protein MdtA [Cupriavidus metallidurans]QBP08705.1 MdtA/MuxA family multidrug efflux RND transporter periplasmic adaptor subunit [Cupriavidus metallidurans]QWC89126.1 MdtA/MuxA family multidrug efflux RND transporter periplasmic adaptor subunit [Cupriavidus metallidurans]UBM1151
MSNPEQGQPTPPNPPTPGGNTRSRRRTWIAGAVIVVLAGAGWYWHGHRKAAQQAGATSAGAASGAAGMGAGKRGPGGASGAGGPGGPGAQQRSPVVVNRVTRRNMDVVLNGLGNVTPVANVTVRAQVSGPLLKVLFKEGQMVKAGDVLAEIDPRPFQATLDQAVGQLARDQALLQNARLDQKRYKTLLAQDSISSQQVDTQDALVRQYEGTVKTDQGNVDNARIQLGYTRIVAPTSGRIGLRQVDPGNIVNPSDTNGIALITQIQPIAVLYTIPEDNLPSVLKKLNAGEKLAVQAWDRQMRNQLGEGTLLTTDNQIDTTTGTVKLKAIFANTDGMLFPNQFVNVRTRIDTLEDATVIPIAAIQRGQQGTFVYVVDDQSTVKVQVVTLGPGDGSHSAVLKGLEPGQRVVVDGADRLKEGMTVEAVDPAARAAALTPASSPRARGRRGGGASGAHGASGARAASGAHGSGASPQQAQP